MKEAKHPDATTDQTIYKNLDVAKTIDRQGRATFRRYDAIRELLETTDPLGRTTQYTWCTCGGLATLTDANGNVTTWGLDEQGRVTSKTYADSTQILYHYEPNAGRLHKMTDALGSVAVYAYNADNTLASTTYTPNGGAASTPNVSFSYDTIYNRVTSMTDGTGTTSYSYNPITGSVTTGAGRLSSVSVPIAGSSATVTYGYDQLGRVNERDIDHATTDLNNASTTFDALGRVTNISNPLGAFTYAYVDETSRLSGVTYPTGTGLSTSYSYFGNTGDQRLETIQNLKSSTQLSKFDYTYNPVGTIATWTQQADSSTAVVNTLTYDNADQLTGAAQSGGGSAYNDYAYDPAGNRVAETTGSGTTGGQFNNLNQLIGYSASTTSTTVAGTTTAAVSSVNVDSQPATITSGTNFSVNVPLLEGTNIVSVVAQPTSGPTTTKLYKIVATGTTPTQLTYDANGNTLTDENGKTYQWDALNRLTKITYYPSTAYTTFAYDGLSRRTQIAEYDSSHDLTCTKNYLWIGSEMAEERDASNAVTKRFFPQGEQQAGTDYYYTRDHLRSVRELCDSSGTILTRYSYDPYGRMTPTYLVTSPSTIDATFRYTSDYYHAGSNLNLTKNRAFDQNTGRWLSRDPIQEKGGLNLYGYVLNDVVDAIDQEGLYPDNFFNPNDPPRRIGNLDCGPWEIKSKTLESMDETSKTAIAVTPWQNTSPVVFWYGEALTTVPLQQRLVKYRVQGFKKYFEVLERQCCDGVTALTLHNSLDVTEPFEDEQINKQLRINPDSDPDAGPDIDVHDPEPEFERD